MSSYQRGKQPKKVPRQQDLSIVAHYGHVHSNKHPMNKNEIKMSRYPQSAHSHHARAVKTVKRSAGDEGTSSADIII